MVLSQGGRGSRDFDVPGDGRTGSAIGRGRGTVVERNVIDRSLEQDEMKLAPSDGEQHFRAICDALLDKGDLAGYSRPGGVTYPIPGE